MYITFIYISQTFFSLRFVQIYYFAEWENWIYSFFTFLRKTFLMLFAFEDMKWKSWTNFIDGQKIDAASLFF